MPQIYGTSSMGVNFWVQVRRPTLLSPEWPALSGGYELAVSKGSNDGAFHRVIQAKSQNLPDSQKTYEFSTQFWLRQETCVKIRWFDGILENQNGFRTSC